MIVLDTHIWVNWILGGDTALSPAIVDAMQNESHLAVSAISCFEVSLLASRGKLELPLPIDEWLTEALAESGVASLPMTCEIANRAVLLSQIHRDPASHHHRNRLGAWGKARKFGLCVSRLPRIAATFSGKVAAIIMHLLTHDIVYAESGSL